MSDHAVPPAGPDDWDRLIDNTFNIGPFSRSMKADDWWVLTGMHVRLPEALAGRPAGTSKLLVLADTISVEIPRGMSAIRLDAFSDVLLIGDSLLSVLGSRNFARSMPDGAESFRMAVVGRSLPLRSGFHFTVEGGTREGRSVVPAEFRWFEIAVHEPVQREFYFTGPLPSHPEVERYGIRDLPLPTSGPGFDACATFLARLLLTAQSLFDTNRAADAHRLLDRIETLVAFNPGVASWQEVLAQCVATREMFEPQLQGPNRVPVLSQNVYASVARSYGPALKAFADRFDQFVDRTVDINQRKQAATLMLRKEDNALRFQALVTEQLETNLKAATESLSRAQTSMESQTRRVEEAERVFQEGLGAWRRDQKRQADLAITGAVFSAVVGVAMIFAGKPTDLSGLAARAAKAGAMAVKIVETLKKLEKIIRAVARLVTMIREILPAASRIRNAAALAGRMADVRREADASDLDGAPSESAYWDQFWVEIETALAPAVSEGVRGATEYEQQLKVLIIYGRALTAAQIAITPIAQELAQATLLTKLAEEQSRAITRQIQTLETGPTSPALAVALWLRHRSVRRAVFTALQDFDAAHRYWALTDARPPRNPGGSITDLAEDLLHIADLEASMQRALDSFRPPPQNFANASFEVPATAITDFLRDGSFALRLTPDFGPVASWGNVGRVRVHEVRAWVIWNDDTRPRSMELTIRTDGNYYDQRFERNGPNETDVRKEFRFIGPRVNQTFRYDPRKADSSRSDSIIISASVAEDFRGQYSQPTLFTEWDFSLPRTDGSIDPGALAALQGAVKGIELEFSGTFIKDEHRF